MIKLILVDCSDFNLYVEVLYIEVYKQKLCILLVYEPESHIDCFLPILEKFTWHHKWPGNVKKKEEK